MKLKLKQHIGMSVDIAVVNTAQRWNKIKLLNITIEIKNEGPEYEIKMKFKLKQNIGMSVHIDIEVTENEIKNEKCVSCIRHNASCIKKGFQPPLLTF